METVCSTMLAGAYTAEAKDSIGGSRLVLITAEAYSSLLSSFLAALCGISGGANVHGAKRIPVSPESDLNGSF